MYGRSPVLMGREDMVNDCDSFVLDGPEKIYVYDGPHASPLGLMLLSGLCERFCCEFALGALAGRSKSKQQIDMLSIWRV